MNGGIICQNIVKIMKSQFKCSYWLFYANLPALPGNPFFDTCPLIGQALDIFDCWSERQVLDCCDLVDQSWFYIFEIENPLSFVVFHEFLGIGFESEWNQLLAHWAVDIAADNKKGIICLDQL